MISGLETKISHAWRYSQKKTKRDKERREKERGKTTTRNGH